MLGIPLPTGKVIEPLYLEKGDNDIPQRIILMPKIHLIQYPNDKYI